MKEAKQYEPEPVKSSHSSRLLIVAFIAVMAVVTFIVINKEDREAETITCERTIKLSTADTNDAELHYSIRFSVIEPIDTVIILKKADSIFVAGVLKLTIDDLILTPGIWMLEIGNKVADCDTSITTVNIRGINVPNMKYIIRCNKLELEAKILEQKAQAKDKPIKKRNKK